MTTGRMPAPGTLFRCHYPKRPGPGLVTSVVRPRGRSGPASYGSGTRQVAGDERGEPDLPARSRVRRRLSATAIGDGETQAPQLPGHPGPVRYQGMGTRPGARSSGHAGHVGEEAWPCCRRRPAPIGAATWCWAPSRWRCKFTSRWAMPPNWTGSWAGAAFAGTSWLELGQLGSLRFGSPLMNITADATLPGASVIRLRRRGHPGPQRRHRPRGHLGRCPLGPGLGRPAGLPPGGMVRGRRSQPHPHGADDQRRASTR